MNTRTGAHAERVNRTAEPYIGPNTVEKERPHAQAHLLAEQVLQHSGTLPGPGTFTAIAVATSTVTASRPGGTAPGSMFEVFEQGNVNARAWIARNQEDERAPSPPSPALSPSAASRRGVDGARAALVGWTQRRGNRSTRDPRGTQYPGEAPDRLRRLLLDKESIYFPNRNIVRSLLFKKIYSTSRRAVPSVTYPLSKLCSG